MRLKSCVLPLPSLLNCFLDRDNSGVRVRNRLVVGVLVLVGNAWSGEAESVTRGVYVRPCQ